jgi:hypothetical protein
MDMLCDILNPGSEATMTGLRSNPDAVAEIYLGIAAATAGHGLPLVRAALAMSITLIGEQHGLHGAALIDWIDSIANTARKAAGTAADARRRPQTDH